MDTCCESIAKYLMFLLNIFFFLCGIVVIVLASLFYRTLSDYEYFLGDASVSAGPILIAVGVLITLTSFMGCCGAITEKSCMMYSFGVIMTIILIAEIGVAVAILVFKSDVEEYVRDNMSSNLDKYTTDDVVQSAWDGVQEAFDCCGVNNYTDWKDTMRSNVPDSCCIDPKEGCGTNYSLDKINREGCLSLLVDEIKNYAIYAGGIGIGFGIFQIVLIGVAFCMGRRMNR